MMQNVADSVNFILFSNPVSAYSIETLKYFGRALSTFVPPKKVVVEEKKEVIMELYRLAGCSRNFIRLAGLFGMSAVAFGVYGAHVLHTKEGNDEYKYMFDIANRYHFFHSLALLASPLTKYPKVTGTLISVGIVLFSGSIYYKVITQDNTINRLRVTPIGGSILMLGWLSMAL